MLAAGSVWPGVSAGSLADLSMCVAQHGHRLVRSAHPGAGRLGRLKGRGAPAADPKQGWTGPFMVLTDGLAFNGSAWTPELAACAPGGCLGDAPALGLDQHGLWRAAHTPAPSAPRPRQAAPAARDARTHARRGCKAAAACGAARAACATARSCRAAELRPTLNPCFYLRAWKQLQTGAGTRRDQLDSRAATAHHPGRPAPAHLADRHRRAPRRRAGWRSTYLRRAAAPSWARCWWA